MENKNGLPMQFLPSMAREYLQRVADGARVGNSPTTHRILNWFCSGAITPGKFARAERLILRHAVRAPSGEGRRRPSGLMIQLGVMEDGSPWNISLNSLAKHSLLLGASGSGKSVTLRAVIGGILEQSNDPRCPHVLAFDFKKSLRRLSARFNEFL